MNILRFNEEGPWGRQCHKKAFKSVTSIFSGGSPSAPAPVIIPPPEPLPAPPSRSDAETEALAEENRRQNTPRRAGRASTFLTGAGTTAASSAVRFLGGSANT